jgi:hypothetical protein
MENENKEKVILTDEELKEVAGGKEVLDKITLSYLIKDCKKYGGAGHCIQMSNGLCAWINNECVPNPKKYEY